jgi:catechol 2,3-dioxygenase
MADFMNPVSQQSVKVHLDDTRRLPDSSKIQYAHFRVSDLDRALQFYKNLLGLVETKSDEGTLTLSAYGNSEPLLRLTEDRAAERRQTRSPGLFHLALLYPTRKDLAKIFKQLYVRRWPFQGFAHHGVSEALYLADADGNGIELYRDLPREQWPYKNGELQMVTEPLDLDDLLSELNGRDIDDRLTSEGLSIGHVHLQVSDLQRTEEFYHKTLGFDVVQRSFPGALFMSAGGYHHHIGANVWNSRGATPAHDGALGLVGYGISLGDEQSRRELAARLRPTSNWISESDNGFFVRDADHIQIEIN